MSSYDLLFTKNIQQSFSNASIDEISNPYMQKKVK